MACFYFLSATRRFCSKYLKDNFNHYMQDMIGIYTKERQHLMNVVFGQDGLTNTDTTLMFEVRSTMVTEEMKEYPALCQYYEKQMKPRIPSQPERIRSTTMDQQQF
jgi:excinuclease UvrABC nuclease subunit